VGVADGRVALLLVKPLISDSEASYSLFGILHFLPGYDVDREYS